MIHEYDGMVYEYVGNNLLVGKILDTIYRTEMIAYS